jgi:hypothetical protein
MSLLIDPPLLYATGRVLARAAPPPSRVPLALAAVGALQFTGVSLYLNRPWTRPIWRVCRSRSGRDWMLNSDVLHFDADRAGIPTHLFSGAVFATYPVWMRLGLRHGRA